MGSLKKITNVHRLLKVAAVLWLTYCRYGVKPFSINQSISKQRPSYEQSLYINILHLASEAKMIKNSAKINEARKLENEEIKDLKEQLRIVRRQVDEARNAKDSLIENLKAGKTKPSISSIFIYF